MSINTRANLNSAVTDYLARTDFTTSQLQNFIDQFEAVANRTLRCRQMEANSTLTATNGVATLPTDFLAWRSFTWEGDPTRQLEYVEPAYLRGSFPSSPSGVPLFFTIEGENLTVAPTDDSENFTLRYFQKLDSLDADDATNWLLTAHPDCYLAGCMFEAQKYLQNAEGALYWKAQRDEHLREITKLDAVHKGPGMIRSFWYTL